MSFAEFVLLAIAGVGTGLIGSVAGLASLISYPALLAAGLSPVAANQTNTVALVFSSAGSIQGSRTELRDQWRRLWIMIGAATAGGVVGGGLLLLTPPGAFTRIVPWLIALASVAILLPRRPVALRGPHHDGLALAAALFLVGTYGGYFGAAAGVMTLALLLRWTGDTVARSNAAKNVILGAANGIAAFAFAVFGSVHWLVMVPLAVGCLVGGRLGPIVVRRSPPQVLRVLIAVAGLGLAAYLAVDAYR